ncbi:MAG: hypothetical protein Q8O88_01035 [bacterium]|nr:hypothetical protein [bacterium]
MNWKTVLKNRKECDCGSDAGSRFVNICDDGGKYPHDENGNPYTVCLRCYGR